MLMALVQWCLPFPVIGGALWNGVVDQALGKIMFSEPIKRMTSKSAHAYRQ